MISAKHPYHFAKELFEEKDAVFSFSKYVYIPDSLIDDRQIVNANGGSLTEEFVEKAIKSLRDDQELAFHSSVSIKGRNYHIPMIDFSIEHKLPEFVFDRLSRYIPKHIMLNMAFFYSGRSFHAYSTTLLTPREWVLFLGKILLVNTREMEWIVDSRWVGHRIIGGFGALRWSNNSGAYKGMPTRITFP